MGEKKTAAAPREAHIRFDRDDRENIEAIKNRMESLGVPRTRITLMQVVSFALRAAARAQEGQ
jgi:hypothetical protein